eukprot:GHVS01049570.1.p1 GENE.GHVS01049570.1~~GHVS01049570.1.p1  ORF type:complete len:150 (-),score=28.96 GHVS01049570.1:104-553(-)
MKKTAEIEENKEESNWAATLEIAIEPVVEAAAQIREEFLGATKALAIVIMQEENKPVEQAIQEAAESAGKAAEQELKKTVENSSNKDAYQNWKGVFLQRAEQVGKNVTATQTEQLKKIREEIQEAAEQLKKIRESIASAIEPVEQGGLP